MTFEAFQKIPRLNRQCVVTEKIDGTNAQVWIEDSRLLPSLDHQSIPYSLVAHEGMEFAVAAGSRTRWISQSDDNHGFAKWVFENREELIKLGPGRHFGEWWGSGIQRGYGLKEKRFSLFNTHRWADSRPACCHVVPVLYTGAFNVDDINVVVDTLKDSGSIASPGFMKPEGVIVFHTAANSLFKVTCEKDESPKGAVE